MLDFKLIICKGIGAKLVRWALWRSAIWMGWFNPRSEKPGTEGLRDSKNCLDDPLAIPLAARTKTWRGWHPIIIGGSEVGHLPAQAVMQEVPCRVEGLAVGPIGV